MSDSHPDLVSATERLQTQLRDSFIHRDARVSSIDWAPYPLLLLESRRELAAFAVSNGDQPEAFRSSYEFFRTMYGERHRTWDDLHLSFVFCVGHRSRDLETLYTGIETDVFFCRKYTVALDEPLESELARLPFVPLHRPTGKTLRPASAQAVLKGMGTSAKLAAALAGRVGEETLLQNCLEGDYDLPAAVDIPHQDLQTFESLGSSVRLKTVEIEDFRAYRKKCRFDVDADLVLLYGPNGFGKTSFFDALDFAATGDIGRLRLDRNETRFTKAASHLDASPEAGVVNLTFAHAGVEMTLRRTVADRRRAFLADRSIDRKEALLALTAATPVAGADHVEHLVRLFRASHIFSQDFQALTDELREHSRLSTEVVSRMLTFEDYVAVRRKIARVLEVAEQRRSNRSERIGRLEEDRAKLQDERRRLKQHGETAKAPLLVDSLRERIREMLTTIGISSVREDDLAAEALGWRAALDAGLSDANARRTALERLRNETTAIADIRRNLEIDRRVREEQRVVAAGLSELLRANEVKLRGLEAEADRVGVELQGFEKQQANHRWLKAAMQQRSALALRQGDLERQISETVRNISDDTAKLAGIARTVSERELAVQRSDTELGAIRQRIADLTRIRDQWTEWSRRNAARSLTVDALANARHTAEVAARQESESAEELSLALKQQENVAAEVKRFESAQTELQNLLARLEAYVVDSKCPACGADHESSDAVLLRLRDHRRTTAKSAEATGRLADIGRRVALAQAAFGDFRSESRVAKEKVESLQSEISDIDKQDTSFATDAAPFGGLSVRLGDTLGAALEEAAARELVIAGANLELREAMSRAQDERTSLTSAVESLSDQLSTTREAADGLLAAIEEIRAEARARECDLEGASASLEEAEARATDEQQKLAETLTAKRAERDATAKDVAESARSVQLHQKATQTTEKAIRAGQERVAGHERDRELLLGKGATGDALNESLQENAGRIQQLEAMKQEIISFEIAVDSAATAAAAARIKVGLQQIDSDAAVVTAEEKSEQNWADQFRRIEAGLARTQDDAVAGYTNIYGPLTSTIQRRLRAVSGFGDIVLKPDRGSIDVNVLRKGERLPPTDYFSQSQQQILMLSLFLTACVTQTWSSFAPILLDDPISNFDDLNAYALLDLIGGLVEEEPGRRQFVFALCDERMFKLARQRFRNLSGGMREFRFQSIGPDGPTVETS